MKTPIPIFIIAPFILSACDLGTKAEGLSPNQEKICEVSEWRHDAAKKICEPGQKIIFLPQRWGNEQLPILFAAVNCDLRFSVALTNGSVTCIYNPIKPQDDKGGGDIKK